MRQTKFVNKLREQNEKVSAKINIVTDQYRACISSAAKTQKLVFT